MYSASCTSGSDSKTISSAYCCVLGTVLSTHTDLILAAALSRGAVGIIVPVVRQWNDTSKVTQLVMAEPGLECSFRLLTSTPHLPSALPGCLPDLHTWDVKENHSFSCPAGLPRVSRGNTLYMYFSSCPFTWKCLLLLRRWVSWPYLLRYWNYHTNLKSNLNLYFCSAR